MGRHKKDEADNGRVEPGSDEATPLMRFPWKKKTEKQDIDDDDKEQKDAKKEPEKKVSLIQLFRYADKLDMLLLVVGGCLSAVTGLGMPLLSIVMGTVTQNFINISMDMLNTNNTQKQRDEAMNTFQTEVIDNCVQYSLVGVAIFIAASVQVSCFLTACERMTDRLRRYFVRAALRQDVAWFDTSLSSTLASKLFDNLERVREGTGDKVALLIQYTSQFIGGFVVAFSYDWRLTLIMMSLSPFMMICGGFIAKLMANATAEEAKKYAVAGSIAEEVLTSIRTVHAFNAQPHEANRYEKALEDGKTDGIKKAIYVGMGLACTFMIIFSSYCLAFWVGTDYVYWGWMEPGTVMTVFFSVMMGSMALGQAGPQFAVIGSAQGAAATLHEIIDRVPEIDAYSTEGLTPQTTHGHIKFENVRFTYPSRPDVEVLKGIDLECKPGETIALVGSSGCGKSTSVSLLLRYYDPTHGRVTLDGVGLRDLNIAYIRNTIGVVSQEPVLFDTTIEENIRFGREDVTSEEISEALKCANAYDFVTALPEGISTLVGTRGTQLSGGQKQRVAIARALVRNPRILLLDEATSALDAHSERVVQSALENASKGRSTVVVAHRLSTVRNANCILVFKDGRVVEKGTHDELMERGEHYYALVHSQVFTDMHDDEESNEESPARRTSRIKSRDSRLSILKSDTAAGEEDKAGESKEKNELKRLKKELEEEGVPRVGLLGILFAARSEWLYIAIAIVASAVQGCIFPAFSLFFSEIISIFANPDQEEMRKNGHFYSLMFLVLGATHGLSMLVSCFFYGLASELLTMRLRLNVFRRLLSMQIAFMDDPKHAPARLCTRLATDAPMVKSALDYRLGSVIGSLVSISCGIGIAFYYGWQMALLLIAIFPLGAVGQAIQIKYIESRSTNDNFNLEVAGKVATEAMENVRTVQALTLQNNVFRRFCAHLDGPLQTSTRKALMQGISYGFSSSIFYFLYAAAFRFGCWLVLSGYMVPMYVLKVLFAISFTAGSLGMASAYFPEYVKATFAAGLIFRMLNLETEIESIDDEDGLKQVLDGAITFEDVHFAYEQRKEAKVLRGMRLSAKPGQTVALVGPSGCGKSTVVSLLQRLYDPTQGTILIDGHSLLERNLRNVRSQMSIVSQEPVLFDMTIRENIAYGLEDTSMEAVFNASRMANAHDFITAMPDGYDTRVGSKGTQLSGGQKQRVAIARALIRNPRILLLDEATSALDMQSEKVVQDALGRASEGRTVIVIAHRLATVVGADSIIVVNDGAVVEQGKHDDLMAAKGAYYKLSAQQANSTGDGETSEKKFEF